MSVGIAASGVADAVKCLGFCSGGAAKNPEGFASWVVLARIDMDEQLRLGLFPRNQRKRGDEQRRYKATIKGPLANCKEDIFITSSI